MIPVNLAFIAANGLGIWDWNLLTKKRDRGDSIFAFDPMRNENFSHAVDNWDKYLHPDDREYGNREIQAALYEGKLLEMDFRICEPDTDILHIKVMVKVLHDNAGKPIKIQGSNINISKFKLCEEKVKLADSVFAHASEGITITDPAGKIINVNDTFSDITGYSRQEVQGKNPRLLQSGLHLPIFFTDMWKTLAEKDLWSGEIWNRRKNGEIYPETLTISNVRDTTGNITHIVSLSTDISHIKEHQHKIEKMSNFDTLTNLPNRALLRERLSQAKRQSRSSNLPLAVVFIDLDEFKVVNDIYGKNIGDKLLVAISERMNEGLRESDSLARIGGDEFVAVLTGFESIEHCKPILERLLRLASEPVTVGDVKLHVSASIGVTFYPQDDSDSDLLIRHADQAMYEAKHAGKNRYHFFDSAQDMAVTTLHENLQRIHIALKQGEFVLYYQPKVNIKKGSVIGAEALIRWQHPEHGLLPPGEFLPLIENDPISIELGEWVIASALSQIAAWQASGLDIPVSINISAFQLQQDNFATRLQALLLTHPEVEPSSLRLEVLETSKLDDLLQVTEIMNECIELGVSFALDDFGTGYSSLTYLRHLPVQIIKIDQSFVRDMLTDPDDLMIVESVVGLAKSFKREVIAEGVETIAHSNVLLQLGCDLAQGYGIARPMPAKEIPEWAANWSLVESRKALSSTKFKKAI